MQLKKEFFLQSVIDSDYLTDGICEDNLILYLRVSKSDEGVLNEAPLQSIQKELLQAGTLSLDIFTRSVSKIMDSCEFQSPYAFSAGIIHDQGVYLITRGLGGVFLIRDNEATRIIMDNQNASGQLSVGEMLLFGHYDLKIDQGVVSKLANSWDDLTSELSEEYKSDDMGGFIVVSRVPDDAVVVPETSIGSNEETSSQGDAVGDKLGRFSKISLKRDKLMIFLSITIVVILLWSVVFGYKRRMENQINDSAREIASQIDAKLIDAEESALFDVSQAKSLVRDAKVLFTPIKERAEKNNLENNGEIKKIADKIDAVEKKIDEIENKKPEEFYDTALLGKNVQIDQFTQTDGESIGLLDTKHGKVYNVAIEKKQVDTFVSSKIKSATRVVIDKNNAYILTPQGVYVKKDNGQEKRVVENKEWGKIADMAMYNGNIYLLDSQKDEVYKYLVASEDVFSAKTSYFKEGQSVDLKNSVGFAVDGSFFIAFSDKQVLKYTSGINQSLTLKTEKEFIPTKILTNITSDKIFIFDKQNGKVLIFNKEGDFKREITSRYLEKAKDIVLIKNDRLVFQLKSKLYLLK